MIRPLREPPLWTGAAFKAYDQFVRTHGKPPSLVRISPAVARHMRDYAGSDSHLLGVSTVICAEINGVEFCFDEEDL